MYHVSIELYKRKWKFGRTRNAMETRAAGECFLSFYEFSQTFTSVFITPQKYGVHVFYFFQKTMRREKGKQLVNFDYQTVNSLCTCHHYANRARQFCVSIELYKHDFNQSARMLSQDCFLKSYIIIIIKSRYYKHIHQQMLLSKGALGN